MMSRCEAYRTTELLQKCFIQHFVASTGSYRTTRRIQIFHETIRQVIYYSCECEQSSNYASTCPVKLHRTQWTKKEVRKMCARTVGCPSSHPNRLPLCSTTLVTSQRILTERMGPMETKESNQCSLVQYWKGKARVIYIFRLYSGRIH